MKWSEVCEQVGTGREKCENVLLRKEYFLDKVKIKFLSSWSHRSSYNHRVELLPHGSLYPIIFKLACVVRLDKICLRASELTSLTPEGSQL